MKPRLIILIVLCISGVLFSQTYPELTIMDIQTISQDTLDTWTQTQWDTPSPHVGDTVTITGVVMFKPIVEAGSDPRITTYEQNSWALFIQDESGAEWGGMSVIQLDTQFETFLDLADTADIIQFTGRVVEDMGNTTRLELLTDPLTQTLLVNILPSRPNPIELNISDFMNNGQIVLDMEKYENMYVVFRNVLTSERQENAEITFKINDEQGNQISILDHSGFNTQRSHRLSGLTDYAPPADQTTLEYIRGIIQTRADGFYLVPLYPNDIEVGALPPTITQIDSLYPLVQWNSPNDISTQIVDLDGSIVRAQLKYRINEGTLTTLDMTNVGNVYSATIPGVLLDSAIVDFFIEAEDNIGKVSRSPSDTSRSRYFYLSLNRGLKISDIQKTPFFDGDSPFENFEVTVSGIITAKPIGKTFNFPVTAFMQDASTIWSGIGLLNAPPVERGDEVTVTGIVKEQFGFTKINVSSLLINSQGNQLPDPIFIPTGTIETGYNQLAEKYESVLIQYRNITISQSNPDDPNNFGEMLVDDNSGETRILLRESNISYHNGFPGPGTIELFTGDQFASITGVLAYTFSNFKLVPRSDNDFVGYTPVDVEQLTIPIKQYALGNNYPNPFNPSTTIQYQIPEEQFVSINVYNTLGEVVANLVNEQKSAGNYTVNFNASNFSSGVYFYQIRTNNFTQVKKMLLTK